MESYINEEWDSIPQIKVHQLVSFPRFLCTIVKKKEWMQHSDKQGNFGTIKFFFFFLMLNLLFLNTGMIYMFYGE